MSCFSVQSDFVFASDRYRTGLKHANGDHSDSVQSDGCCYQESDFGLNSNRTDKWRLRARYLKTEFLHL
jgi:hypothetical protein